MIVPGARYAPISYESRLETRSVATIDMVVIHCTELPDMRTAREYGDRIHYTATETGNCGHLYIDRAGTISQFAALDRVAHHVRGRNQTTIGIELVNRGRFPNWFDSGSQLPSEPYPKAQIDALVNLLRSLRRLLPSLITMAGHEDLDTELVAASNDPNLRVRRKLDPGPLFPWSEITERLPNLKRLSSAEQEKERPT